ncbi:MAG: hypothetical protein J6C40_11395 [Lentisphaeria bacterium]|nr:hypothetical protein [Lentisphaeria bacterium]
MDMINDCQVPLVPMVAVTGRPGRGWIRQRLTELRSVGIDQFLLYPRSGCELEYMSEEWLNTCDLFIQEAIQLGFHALWLYDEFNWPSGQCGGKVQAASPDYALQLMKCTPKENSSLQVEIITDPRYPNLLHPEAMELFISLTHEVYARRFGQYFGNFIKGIFTDEPSPGYGANYTGDRNGVKTIPYYPELEKDYEKLRGVSFRKDIASPCFAEICRKLIGKRFRENYFDRIRNWCEKHNLLLTGHLMEELNMRNSRNHSATPLAAISGFSMPGCDEIFTRLKTNTFEWLTFGTAHYGIRQRNNGGLAELFALGPADMPLSRMSAMINMAALFGIDHYVLAVSQLDFRGNIGKYAWFNPYSADQPWWGKHMPYLSQKSRESAQLAKRQHAPEIAVRYPRECVEINDLLKTLVQHQFPWHIIGTDAPATAQETEIISIENGVWTLERTAKTFSSYASLVSYLNTSGLRNITILENGTLAKDVFIRMFSDGSAVIQDLSDSAQVRRLTLQKDGREYGFELWGRGNYQLPAWKVLRDRLNRLRVHFNENGEFSFTATQPVMLNFAVRNHSPVKVELDGMPLTPSAIASELPPGFAPLYRSITLEVTSGTHTLRLTDGKEIYPYLPTMWLSGDFAANGTTLSEDRQNGDGLENYSGRIIQSGEIIIPRNAAGFYLDSDEQPTEVLLNGESLGCCEDAPFYWSIPEKFRGKYLKMEIIRETSIGPMFGDVLAFQKYHPGFPDFYSGQYPIKNFIIEPEFYLQK